MANVFEARVARLTLEADLKGLPGFKRARVSEQLGTYGVQVIFEDNAPHVLGNAVPGRVGEVSVTVEFEAKSSR